MHAPIGQKPMVYCTGKFICSHETPCYYLKLFYFSNKCIFYGFHGVINRLGMLGEHSKSSQLIRHPM